MSISVLLVDDQELMRMGFRMVIETQDDLSVVGEASNGRQGVDAARELAPDVLLMDVRMPGPGAPAPGPDERLASLTAREHEVLLLVAASLSNSEIADTLILSEATVKSHVGRVLSKLELRDRVQVVVFAYENGIVRPGHG